MKTFSTFLAEAAKNTHMTHIEDSVLYGGVDGTRQAINALRELRDMLAGHTSSQTDVTVKWDGAPAVFCGIVPPENEKAGQFFVGKKSVFNVSPKYYTTAAEVDADTTGDLAAKLKSALKFLNGVVTEGVFQGDFMFGEDDVSTEMIDGTRYYTFQPNTIVYAVPVDSDAGKEIKAAKIGVVFHTRYTGNSFQSMSSSFNVNAERDFTDSANVWLQDAGLHDLSGTATLTSADTEEVTSKLSIAGKIFQRIESSTLKELENNPEFAQMIEQYNNTYVRRGELIRDTGAHVRNLIGWIEDKYETAASQRKTQRGREAQYAKRDEILAFFSDKNKRNLKLVFDLQRAIVDAKLVIINKLDKLNDMDTFVRTRNGYKTTGDEGYVAIDRLSNNAVKLVDRMEFSYNNFSPDVLKGWDKA
jgi:hypothetical protein